MWRIVYSICSSSLFFIVPNESGGTKETVSSKQDYETCEMKKTSNVTLLNMTSYLRNIPKNILQIWVKSLIFAVNRF